jgi:hypothetical protein
MQTSNYVKTNINIPFINSLGYLCADYHKTSDSNRCTPCWENLINMPYASHARFMYGNLSLVPMSSNWTPTPGRNLGTQWSPVLAVVLGHLILPPSRQPWSRGEKVRPSSYTTTRFTGPITPACNQYVQYLLTGANPSVLNRHKRRLQPWRWRLSTSLSPPFLTDGPPLSPNRPVRYHINILNITL